MEPIIKETKVIHGDDYGGGSSTRAKANWALGLGIFGAAAGATAIARQGGIGGVLGGVTPATSSMPYNTGGSSLLVKECDDVLALTRDYYSLALSGLKQAAQAREVDVAEKFGLFISNRNSIDALSDRVNSAFFDLYKYTRDKDDESNARIAAVETATAVNTAIRPYQDKLIERDIEKAFTWLKNYVDSRMCNVIRGVNTLPLTPTVTGVIGQNCCYQFPAAAAAAAADPAAVTA